LLSWRVDRAGPQDVGGDAGSGQFGGKAEAVGPCAGERPLWTPGDSVGAALRGAAGMAAGSAGDRGRL